MLTSLNHIEGNNCQQALDCALQLRQTFDQNTLQSAVGSHELMNIAFWYINSNYFGSRCQWQNQRISLTLQFRRDLIIPCSALFQSVIMLIDKDGFIAPYHEQIFHVPIQFNVLFIKIPPLSLLLFRCSS
ncbi:unnamed protein product [Adineta ricciae]|uniref:Uncharacterized protein n=1 Tax=Adineta ricciae TaxID=249248 RepID=A0A815N6L5_ADIRI|nr:unnamed protein product [Adineta ricciae]CAF1427888.1 unnamed protein product [Adineta ricciae]